MESLPSAHSHIFCLVNTHICTCPPHIPIPSSPAVTQVWLCTPFSAQGINCEHWVYILNRENNHEIRFESFKKDFGTIPPRFKKTDRGPWTSKKWKPGVLINNGRYTPAAETKITKFQGLFSQGLQDSYKKKCTIMTKLPQSTSVCF